MEKEVLTEDEIIIFKNIIIPFVYDKHVQLLNWAETKIKYKGFDLEKIIFQYLEHNDKIIIHLVCHGHITNKANRMIIYILIKEINKILEKNNFNKDRIHNITYQNNIIHDNFLIG